MIDSQAEILFIRVAIELMSVVTQTNEILMVLWQWWMRTATDKQ